MSVIETSPVIFPSEHPIGTSIEAIAVRRLHHFDGLISSPKTNLSYSTRFTETLVLDDIDALRCLTARFSQRLNQLRCPILRLPPEIMQLIIHAYVRSLEEHYFIKRTKKWIQLGHVCHTFRIILSGMHALWAKNAFAPDVVLNDRLLERAHDAPITIKLTRSSPMARLELAVQHLRRAREIDVFGINHMNTIIPELTGQCLPLLDSLSLNQSMENQSNAQPVFSVPHTFTAPNLRHLNFTNVFMQSSECWPTNLTTLKLHRSLDVSPLNLPPPIILLDILRLCCNLHELDLKWYIPDIGEVSQPERNKPVSLPSLRTLSLEEDRNSILRLWRTLIIPPSTQLKISWDDLDRQPGPMMYGGQNVRKFAH